MNQGTHWVCEPMCEELVRATLHGSAQCGERLTRAAFYHGASRLVTDQSEVHSREFLSRQFGRKRTHAPSLSRPAQSPSATSSGMSARNHLAVFRVWPVRVMGRARGLFLL